MTFNVPADVKKAQGWKPHAGQQVRFMSTSSFEALFGGQAGPGKSECLLMESTRQVDNPHYNGILLRRTFDRLEAADGLISRSLDRFPSLGGKYNSQKHFWTFPSGARIYFGHMQYLSDKLRYQSAQFAFIGFDELTEFLFDQYIFMFSRCRANREHNLRCYIRSATNPGNIGHTWVKNRFVNRDIVNRIRWFAMLKNKEGVEVDTEVPKTHIDAKSRIYIPSSWADNPSLSEDYRSNLNALADPVEKARLRDGDWNAVSTDEAIYPNWSTDNISVELGEYNPNNGPVYWSVDDGYQNPRVILLCQHRGDGAVVVFNMLYAPHHLAGSHIKEALDLGYPAPELVYYDPSAVQFAATCWSFEDEKYPEVSLYTVPADNRVQEGLKVVREYIKDGNGVTSLYVHPRCEKLIEELPAYRCDRGRIPAQGGDPPVIKENDHSCDALRYFIFTHCTNLPGG